MSGQISASTAKLALRWLRDAAEEARRNGVALPDVVRRAQAELEAARIAANGNTVAPQGNPVSTSVEQISVAQAAERLGIKVRAVRHRIATGALPAKRIDGRTWLVEWSGDIATKAR